MSDWYWQLLIDDEYCNFSTEQSTLIEEKYLVYVRNKSNHLVTWDNNVVDFNTMLYSKTSQIQRVKSPLWVWQQDHNGAFYDYDEELSKMIDDKYIDYLCGESTIVTLPIGDIDFAQMIITTNNSVRRIRINAL